MADQTKASRKKKPEQADSKSPQTVSDAGSPGLTGELAALQDGAGNAAVSRLVASSNPASAETALRVSQPGDREEQEADSMADAVISASPIAPVTSVEKDASIRHASNSDTEITSDETGEQQFPWLKGRGQPLPPSTRSFVESRLGRDFGTVRVHTDAMADEAARSLNALAFTHGSDVVFRTGKYAPGTDTGNRLLAHELAHVVQQTGRSPVVQRQSAETEATTQKKSGVELDTWATLWGRGSRSTMGGGTRVGTVYFSTDESELDAEDREALTTLRSQLESELMKGERKYNLEFRGWADKRAGTLYNLRLSAKRAESVAEFFSTLSSYRHYSSETKTMGEQKLKGETAQELAPARRVDIIVRPPISKPIEKPERDKEEEKGLPKSKEWRARITDSLSGGYYTGLFLQIVDKTNRLWMNYEFQGLGPSVGGGHGTSSWKPFSTYKEVYIESWKGPAALKTLQIQPGKGFSHTTVTMGANTASGTRQVTFEDWGEGLGLGFGISWGTLRPVEGDWPKKLK